MHIDCPILRDCIFPACSELIAKSRLGSETLHFIATLLERIEETTTTTLLDNFS